MKYTMRLFCLLLMGILMLVLVVPILAQDAPVASVATGTLNVRSGPGLSYPAIAALPFGFGVNMVARNDVGNWIYIDQPNGLAGWVNVNYLYTTFRTRDLPVFEAAPAFQPAQPQVINESPFVNVSVWDRPDRRGNVIAFIPPRGSVPLLGRNYDGSWGQVLLPDGRVGWVERTTVGATVPIRSVDPVDGSVTAPPPPGGPNSALGTSGIVGTYVVRAGDSLLAIARRYNTTVPALMAANNLSNPDVIFVGQTLTIVR